MGHPQAEVPLASTAAENVRFYTRAKAVTTRWPDAGPVERDLSFPTSG
jgi:hypothetical protein